MFDIDWKRYRLVDLSVRVHPPGTDERPFRVEAGRLADDTLRYDVRELHTHVGTHVESPRHYFMDHGKLCEDYTLESFMGRAILLNIRDAVADAVVGPETLERELGALIRPDDIVLARNSDPRREQPGGERQPVVTADAAQWLADRQIRMYGFEPALKLGADIAEGRRAHDILQGREIPLIEFLDLSALSRPEFYYIGLPVAFMDVDSAWCRAVAIEER